MAIIYEHYASGVQPTIGDTRRILLIKEILATIGGSPGSGGAGVVGHGSPEGVVTAVPGTTYLDLDANGFWYKATGTGNTGWQPIVT